MGFDIDADDNLRPQSTFDYKKQFSQSKYDFPNLHIAEPILYFKSWDPVDTYTQDMNQRFEQRYIKGSNALFNQ